MFLKPTIDFLMRKIIYIAGLGHSGSTILDMILGANSKVIGLGEIMPFLRRKDHSSDYKSTCSCGKLGSDCEFWSNVEVKIKDADNYEEAYLKLTDYFFEKYGDDAILVDSSKNSYPYLKKVNEIYDLKVIYLTRDFRSWSFSRFLSKKKLIPLWIFWWIAENKKLEFQFKKMGVNCFNVGYEELALYPKFTIKELCKYLEINFEEDMLNPAKTKSHIINGNVVRADSKKRSKIMYDARWLISGRINFWSGISWILNKQNKKRVYSNVLGKDLKIDNFFMFNNKRRKEIDGKVN